MNAYEIVVKSREKGRPTALDYINGVCEGFTELHGDRKFADDKSMVAGIACIDGLPVTVIGIEKGGDTNQKVMRNFGSAHPEGYRKALRLMKQAEKFKRPVLTFVDTSGPFCGIGAEERGQAEAIADNIMHMMGLKTPTLSVIIGEGGSGGALGLAAADAVWISETSTYSVISPEGCASILWKNPAKVKDAAEALKMTAADLKALGAVEEVIEEQGFSKEYYDKLKQNISSFFKDKLKESTEELLEKRYARYRKMGRK